jgi:hypothetical protein
MASELLAYVFISSPSDTLQTGYRASNLAPEMERSREFGINRIEKGEWLILYGMIAAKGECHVFAG